MSTVLVTGMSGTGKSTALRIVFEPATIEIDPSALLESVVDQLEALALQGGS